MTPDWHARYELMVETARIAGDLARSFYDTTFDIERKADDSPVTIADRQAEDLIRKAVSLHFPQDGLLGEEFGDHHGTSGFRWIIDPIDGTKNFIRHIPIWATLIGLEYRDEQIAGVTYVPVLGQVYRALRGDGAFLNDRRIHVSDVQSLAESFLSYSSLAWFLKTNQAQVFLELVAKSQRQRGLGDFYGFVLVAEGAVDVMVDHGVHAWDVAALKPIVEEAGGKFTNWQGHPTIHAPDVLATNGVLHEATLSILNPIAHT